jgi:acetyl esterase/lipase
MPKRDWDDAFANMAHVPNSDALPQFWSERAAAYRSGDVRIEEIAYGTHARERIDIVWPDITPVELAVFVHGGYWMRLDKSHWTDLAEGARGLGWAVCIPSYTLAPEARISSMTKQIGEAIQLAAKHVDGPIRLAGHSAGGHLVTRMLCQDTPLHDDVLARIEHTLSISGLHDLRPLLHTKMNDTLKLDIAEATRESAALKLPNGNPSITAWVGGNERPEFIRQAQIFAQMWEGLDADMQCVIDGEHNHFTVIEGLKESDSAITRAFVEGHRITGANIARP